MIGYRGRVYALPDAHKLAICPFARVGYNLRYHDTRNHQDKLLKRSVLLAVWLFLLLTACQPRDLPMLPTEIPQDLDAVATAIQLTENAPPDRFKDGIRLPQLGAKTEQLASWRAIVQLQFDGIFAGTSRQTRAASRAEIQHELLGSKRRVVLSVDGALFEQDAPLVTEGVRLGPDTFFVRDQHCAVTTDSAMFAIADLDVSTLIGGVDFATPDGSGKAIINGTEVWRYAFTPDALTLQNLNVGGGRILDTNGELWFSPTHEAVVRFYLVVDAENVTVFDSQTPVTGTLTLQYDLLEIDTPQNISVPFGC